MYSEQTVRMAGAYLFAVTLAFLAVADANSDTEPVPDGIYETVEPTGRGTGKVYMDREIASVMSHRRMRSLDRPERESEERPDLVVAALPLDKDDIVADIGAGTGYFSFRVASRVPDGEVLAVDIQQEMLDEIERRKKERDVSNIRPVLGKIDDPGLGEHSVDLIFIVDAYHEFSHPYEMGRAMYAALRPGGYLIVVEERAEDSSGYGGNLHEITEEQARREIGSLGFAWQRTETFLPQQHFLVFQKPASPGRALPE